MMITWSDNIIHKTYHYIINLCIYNIRKISGTYFLDTLNARCVLLLLF